MSDKKQQQAKTVKAKKQAAQKKKTGDSVAAKLTKLLLGRG